MPSNMALVRVGGALWLGVIVTLWGIVATCFAGLSSATMCESAGVVSVLTDSASHASFLWALIASWIDHNALTLD